MKKFIVQIVVFSVSIIVTVPGRGVHADVPPPNSEGCQNASKGARCRTDEGRSGVCETQTCSRLDYSNVDDAGTPGTSNYDCLICVAKSSDDGCAFVPHSSEQSFFFQLLSLIWK